MSVIHVNESAKFKELVSTGVSLIDYSASWCGPCKRVAPVFEDLAKENPNVKFIHIDIDEASESMPDELLHVSGVPHFELFHNGQKVSQFAGANLTKIKESVQLLKSKLEAHKEVKEEKKEEPIEVVIKEIEVEKKEKPFEEVATKEKSEENNTEPEQDETKPQEEKPGKKD